MRVAAVVLVTVFLCSSICADDKNIVEKNASDREKQVKPEGQSKSENQPVSSEIPTHRKEMKEVRNQVELIYPQPNIFHATNTYEPMHYQLSTHEKKIREALESQIKTFDFRETPLRDVAEQIEDEHGIQVELDIPALEDAGLDPDCPITNSLSGISLRSALRLILGGYYLTYLIKDDLLLITTEDKAYKNPTIVSYPVVWNGDDYQSIIDLIQQTIDPQSWDTVGGNGTILPYPLYNEIFISQTEEVHEDILDLFRNVIDTDASSTDGSVITRTYQITDASLLPDVEKKVIEICSAALGEQSDPKAKITRIGNTLVVQSAVRAFQVYAAEVIRSLQGIKNPQTDFSGAVGVKLKSVTNSIGMELIEILAGSFRMNEGFPAVKVTLTKSFGLGKYEVTQGQWKSVMASEPWDGQKYVQADKDCPATYVNWDDATEFCKKLTDLERKSAKLQANEEYRLPTEAEREYACRAGTKTVFSFGNDEKQLGEYAWFDGNAKNVGEQYAHKVGLKKPNPWGLHDMHGNVWEWCSDWYDRKLSGGTDPVGPEEGSLRVVRGGCWVYYPGYCRSASRYYGVPSDRGHCLGFRVARSQSVQ